jgi:O-antigen/teichoic acid export membrane protein
VPVAVVLAVLAWPIIDFIAGKEYLTASTVNFRGLTISAPRVLFILAFSTGISFLLSIFSQILTVINKQKTQVWPLIVITAGNVALNIILIPRFSYFASAIINLLTVGIMLVWWFVLSRKYLHFKLNYGVIPKAALAGLVMGILMYFLMKFNVVIVAILGGLVYFTAGYLLKMFDWVMIKKLLPSKLTGESDV